MKINVQFTECEHEGDLSNYIDDINASGGEVLQQVFNYNEETADLVISVDDMEDFTFRYRKTESAGFEYPNL